MTEPLNTHGVTMPHGKFVGQPFTRIPIHYLKWLQNVRHDMAPYAKAELERRGTVTPEVEISGHAIDRASQRIWDMWRFHRNDPNEGFHSWLVRNAQEALLTKVITRGSTDQSSEQTPTFRYEHLGVIWVFEQDCEWPVLKTVMKAKGH